MIWRAGDLVINLTIARSGDLSRDLPIYLVIWRSGDLSRDLVISLPSQAASSLKPEA
jgi:hypothetical protein